MNNFKTPDQMAKSAPKEMAPQGGGNFSNSPAMPKAPNVNNTLKTPEEQNKAFEMMGLRKGRNNQPYLPAYNNKGYDQLGYDKEGYDIDGFDRDGYNKEGFNIKVGVPNRFTGTDFGKDGYDIDGYDKNGFNKEGYDRKGYNKDGYDDEGYDRKGYNKDGYDYFGYDKNGFSNIEGKPNVYTGTQYGRDGYNIRGFNNQLMHRNNTKYDDKGYDYYGYDKDGYNQMGFDKNKLARDGKTTFEEAMKNFGSHVNWSLKPKGEK